MEPSVGSRSGLRSARDALVGCFLVLVVLLVSGSCASSETPLAPSKEKGSADSEAQSKDVSVSLVAKENIFEPAVISVSPGALVSVTLQNKGDLPHTFTIRDLEVDTGTVAPGESGQAEFEAPEDDLTFVCSIHEFQGQTGQLVVK